ncbi:hypothetical protein VNO77_03704 [Canavalia gladiata]|uniref:Uncharacterized protein n=1 Tax=Canavalia gladiata TaxID=3824 RepID=A0AAN9N0A9_CANGL
MHCWDINHSLHIGLRSQQSTLLVFIMGDHTSLDVSISNRMPAWSLQALGLLVGPGTSSTSISRALDKILVCDLATDETDSELHSRCLRIMVKRR